MISISRAAAILCAVSFLGGPLGAKAESPDEWRKTENPGAQEQKVQLRQHYTGVKPGDGNALPRVEELRNKGGVWVTWPGFIQLAGGGSRLFIQATEALDYSIRDSGKKVVLTFKRAQVHLSNNRNPLVTTHFNTPLKRAYLKKKRKAVELVLELKVNTTPEISQTADSDGYRYLFVDFAPGDYPIDVGTGNPSFYGVGSPVSDASEDYPAEALPPESAQ